MKAKPRILNALPEVKFLKKMMFPIKNVEDLQKLNKIVSLETQVKAVRLQYKLGEQNYQHNLKKLQEPLIDTIKDTSEKVTKTNTETYINNNKAIVNWNETILELMTDEGMIAPYIASSLVNLFTPENKNQFRLIKDLSSTKINGFLINGGIRVALFSNMLTFRDSNKSFKLDGDLLETMTNYDFNVSLSSPKDQKLFFEFGNEMNFNIKQKGRISDRDRSLMNLIKSPALMASGISTKLLSSDPDEICDILKLLLQKKHAGSNSDLINKEIFAIVDKLLEYKCISIKQHKQIFFKCNLLDTNKK